jgi:hypothetical protein
MRVASKPQPAPAPQVIPTPPGSPITATPYAATPQPAPAYVPAPQPANVTNQMLVEQNNCVPNNCNGVYRGDLNCFEQAACSPDGNGCGDVCFDDCFCPWYSSVTAMVVGRSGGRRIWTSYDTRNEADQISNTSFPMSWRWGGEIKLGRRFCCYGTPYALEGSFWSSDPFNDTQVTSLYSSTTPLYVSTPLDTRNVFYTIDGVDRSATSIFDNARAHTVLRHSEFYDAEINFVREQLAWAADSPWDIGWSVGVRYFRFQDQLSVNSLSFGGDYEAYFKDVATNNLVGAQFGFDAAYNVWNSFRVFITPKVGIYDNIVDSSFTSQARAVGGNYVNGNSGVAGYPDFPVHSSVNGIACLMQIDVGADWQITRNWSLRGGYRVVAINGVALADDQFPQFLCDTPDMGNPQHENSLVLHGAFFGATYNY